jgi:hypothetical protein
MGPDAIGGVLAASRALQPVGPALAAPDALASIATTSADRGIGVLALVGARALTAAEPHAGRPGAVSAARDAWTVPLRSADVRGESAFLTE